MAGNVQSRAFGGRAYTRPGFVGYQLNGVGLGGGQLLNLLTDNGVAYVVEDGASPPRKNVSLIPIGPVELGRFTLDATLTPFDTLVLTPSLPQHLSVLVSEVYLYAVAIAGLTSHPSFAIGFNSPNFNNLLAPMDLSVGGGIAQGEVRRFSFADGANVLEVPPASSLTLRLATQAVATTYSVQAFVFGRVLQP